MPVDGLINPAAPHLRSMKRSDIAAVAAIERASYAEGWPATAFERELSENHIARYFVVTDEGGTVAGYAGCWLMVDEAHVVTVAVDPGRRRRGYGRLLIHGLLLCAKSEGMTAATLECRVSNIAARALYRQYGFYEVGERKKYYPDNLEDAVIMTTEALASPAYAARLARLRDRLLELFPGVSPRAE